MYLSNKAQPPSHQALLWGHRRHPGRGLPACAESLRELQTLDPRRPRAAGHLHHRLRGVGDAQPAQADAIGLDEDRPRYHAGEGEHIGSGPVSSPLPAAKSRVTPWTASGCAARRPRGSPSSSSLLPLDTPAGAPPLESGCEINTPSDTHGPGARPDARPRRPSRRAPREAAARIPDCR